MDEFEFKTQSLADFLTEEPPQVTNPNMPWTTVYESVKDGRLILKVKHTSEIPVVEGETIPLHAEPENPRPGVTILGSGVRLARVQCTGTVDDLDEYIEDLKQVLAYARECEKTLTVEEVE